MDKCPKCGGEVMVLERSGNFWGGVNCVAVENRNSLQQLKAEIALAVGAIARDSSIPAVDRIDKIVVLVNEQLSAV